MLKEKKVIVANVSEAKSSEYSREVWGALNSMSETSNMLVKCHDRLHEYDQYKEKENFIDVMGIAEQYLESCLSLVRKAKSSIK